MVDPGDKWITFKNLGLSNEHGVDLDGVQPEILEAMAKAARVFRRHGACFVVTSVRDGRHSPNSLHYTGRAFDCRTKHLPSYDVKLEILAELEHELGAEYDVLLEDARSENEHIHVEHDPR